MPEFHDPMHNDDAFRAKVLEELGEIKTRMAIIETKFEGVPAKIEEHGRYIQQQTGGARTLNWIIGPVSGLIGAVGSWFAAKSHQP
jgi:hypothetical protein